MLQARFVAATKQQLLTHAFIANSSTDWRLVAVRLLIVVKINID